MKSSGLRGRGRVEDEEGEQDGFHVCVCVYTHAKRSMKWHLTQQQILSHSLNKIHIHFHLSHSLTHSGCT